MPARWVWRLSSAGPPSRQFAFTYVRYNAELSRSGLDVLGLQNIEPKAVQALDSVAHIAELQTLGKAVAGKVQAAHFDGFV